MEKNSSTRLLRVQRTFLYLFYSLVPRSLWAKENIFFLCFAGSALFFLLFVVGPILWLIGRENASISAFVCSFLVFSSILIWRLGGAIVLAHFIYQGALLGVIIYNAYYLGGVTSPVMVWMGLVPILPVFLMSRSWGYGWLLVSLIIVIFMLVLQINGYIPMRVGDSINDLYLGTLMIGMLSLTQMILVGTYDTASWTMLQQITKKNDALHALSVKLKIANAHKDNFLATVSHEMRTPLNGVFGFLNIIERTDNLPTEVYEYVKHAKDSSAHLLTVINDLLDFSQMQKGKLMFSPQVIHLKQTMFQIQATLQNKAKEKNIGYAIRFSGEVPEYVKIDPHRLTQIVLNLLGNAVKFTSKGGVMTEIYVDQSEGADDALSATLNIVISDSGIGIPTSEMSNIFEPFVQGKGGIASTGYSLRGNGLGLAITRSLVLNQGGTISAESTEGIGSVFRVSLPVSVDQAPVFSSDKLSLDINSSVVEILVVDDHQINRIVVINLIKKYFPNAVITEARNGQEALEKMRIKVYDVVLMDLVMPDLSGTGVVEVIRNECSSPFANVNVVALTANLANEAISECNRVQMQGILPKPVDVDLLIRTISRYIRV